MCDICLLLSLLKIFYMCVRNICGTKSFNTGWLAGLIIAGTIILRGKDTHLAFHYNHNDQSLEV
jgi:hypothetical protein